MRMLNIGEKENSRENILVVRADETAEEMMTQFFLQADHADKHILLENGYGRRGNGYIGDFPSDIAWLCETVDRLNATYHTDRFGICYNTGHAILLGRSLPEEIQRLGKRIRLMRLNDNDGRSDAHQMPFTFTTGRGILSTEWGTVIRTLVQMKYEGELEFDVDGLWERVPETLWPAYENFLQRVKDYFLLQIRMEQVLSCGRKIVLFGAGNMFQNYMKRWGEVYPPVFIVDNNPALHGENRCGIEVRRPEDILRIPEEERLVLICNIYYDAIEAQLWRMGIKALRYEELYFNR